MEGGHDLARQVLDTHHFSNRIFNAKKLIAYSATDRANVRGSVYIVLGKCGALIHIPAFYIEVFWGNAAKPCKPVLVSIDEDRKSTRLNSSHLVISYAVFCLKKKKAQR